MKDLSIYIHIPFCKSKCYYCDFFSFTNKTNKIDLYINSLINELKLYKDKLDKYIIKSIFIGGGTPTSIDPKYILLILDFIHNNFNIKNDIELTIEGNPGTLDMEKIISYKNAGINRFSLGLQSLNDDLLKSIGRSHNSKDFYDSYKMLRKIGIDNINVDLMFGLPNQKLEDLIASINGIIELGVEHVSFYGLILEEGTPLYNMYQEGKVEFPDEDVEREMYHIGCEKFKEAGYNHYEISNFAKTGYESKHNMVYWEIKPYIGFGLSSHSCFEGKRFWNTNDLSIYIDRLSKAKLAIAGQEIINRTTEISEFCIMGLRKIEGIDKTEFYNRFNLSIESLYEDIIIKHEKNGLLKNKANYIFLNTKGLDLANLVEIDFYR